jgi:hypothetical protein
MATVIAGRLEAKKNSAKEHLFELKMLIERLVEPLNDDSYAKTSRQW